MKIFFAAYWLIGCFALGTGMSAYLERCPNDVPRIGTEGLALVAAWPATVVVIANLPKGFTFAKKPCEAKP